MSPLDRVIIILFSRQIIRVYAYVLSQPQKMWVFHGFANWYDLKMPFIWVKLPCEKYNIWGWGLERPLLPDSKGFILFDYVCNSPEKFNPMMMKTLEGRLYKNLLFLHLLDLKFVSISLSTTIFNSAWTIQKVNSGPLLLYFCTELLPLNSTVLLCTGG